MEPISQTPTSTFPECQCVYARGKATCTVCKREYNAPHGKVRAYCKPIRPRERKGGPGTELKKLLRSFGFQAKMGCGCNKRAACMDANGAEWCAKNVGAISGWMAEEAKKRGLWYWAPLGKLLILLAIRRAEKGNGH